MAGPRTRDFVTVRGKLVFGHIDDLYGPACGLGLFGGASVAEFLDDALLRPAPARLPFGVGLADLGCLSRFGGGPFLRLYGSGVHEDAAVPASMRRIPAVATSSSLAGGGSLPMLTTTALPPSDGMSCDGRHRACVTSSTGYSLVTNRPVLSGTTPTGYEPDPLHGTREEFRAMCRRIAGRGVPQLVWMSHAGLMPQGGPDNRAMAKLLAEAGGPRTFTPLPGDLAVMESRNLLVVPLLDGIKRHDRYPRFQLPAPWDGVAALRSVHGPETATRDAAGEFRDVAPGIYEMRA